jgi:hypothetical protein
MVTSGALPSGHPHRKGDILEKGISDIKRIKISGLFMNVVDVFWHGNHAIAREMNVVEIERISFHLITLFNEASKEKYRAFREQFLDKKPKIEGETEPTDEEKEKELDALITALPMITQEVREHLNEVLSMCITWGDNTRIAPEDFNNMAGAFYKNTVKGAWIGNRDQIMDLWDEFDGLVKKKSEPEPTQEQPKEAAPQAVRTEQEVKIETATGIPQQEPKKEPNPIP